MIDSVKTIDAKNLANLLNRDESVELVDVRSGMEYRESHIPKARHVALNRLNAARLQKEFKHAKCVVFTCQSGKRASAACAKAMEEGLQDVYVLRDGIAGWMREGLPVERGGSGISLERQVRIAAGILVLAGTALGFWVHTGWLALSAFVGAGLVFAGLTNSCGMAMLLTRMPWNK